jgi:hypothetical protein
VTKVPFALWPLENYKETCLWQIHRAVIIYSTFPKLLYTALTYFVQYFPMCTPNIRSNLYIPTHGPKPGLVTVTVTNPVLCAAGKPPRNPVGNVAHGGVNRNDSKSPSPPAAVVGLAAAVVGFASAFVGLAAGVVGLAAAVVGFASTHPLQTSRVTSSSASSPTTHSLPSHLAFSPSMQKSRAGPSPSTHGVQDPGRLVHSRLRHESGVESMHVLHRLAEEAGLGRGWRDEVGRGGGVGAGGVGGGGIPGAQSLLIGARGVDVAGENGRGATPDVGGFFSVIVIVGIRVWFCHCDENTDAREEHVAAGTEGAQVNAVAVRGSRVRMSVNIISLTLSVPFLLVGVL